MRTTTWIVAAVILIGAVTVLTTTSTNRLIRASEEAEQSHEILDSIDDLEVALAETESARRAYGLSGDERYLEHRDEYRARVDDALRRLRSPRFRAPELSALPELTVTRLALIDEAVEARRVLGPDMAREAENIRRGTALRDPIRELLEGLRVREDQLLVERKESVERSVRYERVVQLAGTLVSAGIMVFVFLHLRREARRRRRSEEEAREAEAHAKQSTLFLDSIVENIPHMVFVKSADELRFVRFNRAGENLLGTHRDDLIGKSDRDLFPPDQAAAFQTKDREVLAAGGVADVVEEPIETPTGTRWLHTKKLPIVDDSGKPAFLLGISEDITERKRLDDRLKAVNSELAERVEKARSDLLHTEEQLRQSQKLEAIGRLAGGVAHDFNNLLSVILSYSELLVTDMPEGAQRTDIEEIHKAGVRATALTRQLLAFSRRQVLAPKILDLNDVISNMEKLLRRLIGEDIDLKLVKNPTVRVKVDPGQIEQVIVNLVVNARDAMPRGGALIIETATKYLDDEYCASHVDVSRGNYVMIAVTDTGIGMDKATQQRIFEPFFTTKPIGQGTGLGLSTVIGIVQQSGGHIWVYSEPGKGTSFKVYFPETSETGERVQAQTGPMPKLKSSATVLLVEDEDQVRTVARTVLAKAGYQVIEAENGEEALLMCKRFSGPIHLVLTDVVMPRMSGRELVEKILVLRPGTKVLFMSGYTDDTVLRHGVDEGLAFLQKPITPEALTRKVHEVLDSQ